jgi:ArsR family transcriptional regulator, virulence genes transcriptional regulator
MTGTSGEICIPGLGKRMNIESLQEKTRRASALLKAMSNEHRLMILCQLQSGERSVGELERLIGLSQSALSQHLARLRRDELVRTRRSAQTIFYSLNGDEATAVINTLYRLYCADPTEAVREIAE